MCERRPGPRCADDTRAQAAATASAYDAAYPDGPPVSPLTAAKALLDSIGVTREQIAEMYGLTVPASSSPRPAPTPARIPIAEFGPVHPEHGPFESDAWNVPDPSRNSVEVNGQTFTRSSRDARPGEPYAVRIEANRVLSNAEVRQLASLVGYANRSAMHSGESLGAPYRDGPASFVLAMDTTKSASDDRTLALEDFEHAVPDLAREGTPIRKTDQSGPGTKGTRKIDGLGVEVSIWWDDVHYASTR